VSGKRGFTLLEMLVASTIMAVAIVGLLSGIAGATRNAARLRDYDRAVQLARLRMNEMLVDGLLTGGLEMGWQARMTTVEMSPSPAAGQPCLQRIELQIWWTSGQQKRSFTLDSFRSHILMPEDL
jgi:general secretion pathway protein I